MIYLKLFLTFLKIGAFTFGGGYAMLPLIQEAVLANGWLEEEALINFIAVSESTPGPFAVNVSTYVGMTVGGVLGAFLATLGVILPSFVIILIVAKIYDKFRKSFVVAGCMKGLKPSVVGLIAAAILSVLKTVLWPKDGINGGLSSMQIIEMGISLGIVVLCTLLSFKKVHPIVVICLSAVIGIGVGYGLNL